MENRLYYDCPISAAYMAKNFNVDFTNQTNSYRYWYADLVENINDEREEKLYIHPDSLSIFEPQEGDLVTTSGYPAKIIGKLLGKTDCFAVEFGSKNDPSYAYKKDIDLIIERNGKPFIMPQQGE